MVLSGNQNSEHFSGKLVSFWGGGFAPPPGLPVRPQAPYRGSAPGPRWDPLLFAPPEATPLAWRIRKRQRKLPKRH